MASTCGDFENSDDAPEPGVAFRVKGGHGRVGLGRQAGGWRQRSGDVVKAEQAGGGGPKEGGAPAGRRRGRPRRTAVPPAHRRAAAASQRPGCLRPLAAAAAGDRRRAGHLAHRGSRTQFLPARCARPTSGRRPAPTRSTSRAAPDRNTGSAPRQVRDEDRVVSLARLAGAGVQLLPGGVHDPADPVEAEARADGGAHVVPAVRGRGPVQVDPGVGPADRCEGPDDLRAGADGQLDIAGAGDPAAQGRGRRSPPPPATGRPAGSPARPRPPR